MLVIHHAGYAQFENILHRSYKEKTGILNKLGVDLIAIDNADSAIGIITRLEMKAKEENDLEAVLESRLLKAQYSAQHQLSTEKVLVNEIMEVATIAKTNHLFITEARAIKLITWYYWHFEGNYELASDYFLKLDELLQKLPDEEFPDKAECLHAIGSCYHFFGDFTKAKGYFLRSTFIRETSDNAIIRGSSVNSLGVCYRDLGMMDSSNHLYENFLTNKNSLAYHTWEGMIAGNLGYNYYLTKEYEKAIPYLLHDKERALQDHDLSLAAGAMTPLADIYTDQNRLEEAGKEIMDCRIYIQKSNTPDRLRLLYPVMSKWYSKTGKGDLAALYVDSTLMAIKKYQEKKNVLQLLRANQRSEIEKSKVVILKIQKEKEHTLFIRNLVIVTLLFSVLLIVVFFRNKSKRHQQEQQIKDLKIQEHEIELARAKDLLAEFSRRITEKNQLIEKLEKESQLQENDKLVVELRQSAILTEEDWSRFKRIFEQVYPRFFEKLKDKFPELSPAETRYITLTKLGFSSNEVANSLGISKKSIHVTWHRIRKKLNLDETKTVNDLVEEID